ncbi:DNA helicase-2 / ATP-dependent DNA helicase PcrA [Oceanospirillum multiglobuliferum]|uniref:DNA 3'-5' helicase n=1 Tax=Oceanospirillum multiglobuliferum TaxID=64969 RepID=A0A1T4PB58_9GAMM|nr:ATP-dependent helicase [Oceanospirillum multiglobuliferum]OPX55635.1 hypothetical protein BTE48_08475 [Oceanospirillum multiglobuliferum]SJZ88476.1 DNA helicase-2 / ATP-dependent DNA helicase PcrA [Oceanospirillum multiglobuliferum]
MQPPVLTNQQQQVVEHGKGHARVMAVAGSGKTTTLVHRVLFLLQQGFQPKRIMVLMYNRAAKEDFTHKIQRLAPYGQPLPDIRTFHSVGHRLCDTLSNWGVIQRRKLIQEGWSYERLMRQAITQALADCDEQSRRTALDLDHLEAFSQFVERVKADLDPAATQFKQLALPDDQLYFVSAFEQLEQLMADQGVMTFSDLLYRPVMALLSQPELKARISNHLDQVIVDEYQDINGIQHYLLSVLAGARAQVMVVGDVDQCIYEWRGARPEFMLSEFAEQFPNPESYALSYSFRYGHTLALAANHLINENREREAQLCLATAQHSDTDIVQLDQLVELLPLIKQTGLEQGFHQCAVLVRSWALSVPIQLAFLQQQIPFKLLQQGHFVFNQPLITQFLAYLDLVVAPVQAPIQPETLTALLSFPPLFLSQQEQQRIQQLVAVNGLDPKAICKSLSLKPYSGKRLLKRLTLLQKLQKESAEQAVGPLTTRLLQETEAFELIEKAAATRDQAEERKRMLQGLVNYLRQQRMSVQALLEQVRWQREAGASLESDQGIIISTVHGAKGLEWPYVVLAGLTEGQFPCYQNLSDFNKHNEESERRLFYVAMTRAQKMLWLLTDTGLIEDKRKKVSRFIGEMSLTDCLNTVTQLKQPEKDLGLVVQKAPLVQQYLQLNALNFRVGSQTVSIASYGTLSSVDTSLENKLTYKIGDQIKHKLFGRGVTAPRPFGRGFQLLRQQPARGRIYASLHWQEPTVLRPLV